MFLYLNFKKKIVFIIAILFLYSCGIVGGGNEKQVSENAVLSGPPLAIPPEFDIESPQNSETTLDETNYEIVDYGELENNNINDEIIYEDNQSNQITNITNDIETQSFENLEPLNQSNVFRPSNKNIRKQRALKRSSVPSDAYNFNTSILNESNVYAKKKTDDFTGFGNQTIEKIDIQESKDLSNEEEFLLNDILNQSSDSTNQVQDPGFEAKGDSD